MKKRLGLQTMVLLMISLSFSLLLNGCQSGDKTGSGQNDSETTAAASQISNEKVTITLFGIPNADEFETLVKPVQKRFPNITLERVDTKLGEDVAEQARQLVAAGTIPDIVTFPTQDVMDMKEMGLFSDLTPMIKMYNFDLQKLVPEALENIKAYSGEGKVMLLPRQRSADVLYYNKDIFDKFGVSYPKDDMTWDDIYELAKKVTRTDNGVQFRGFDAPAYMISRNQLSLPLVDPKTGKAAFNTDSWSRWFQSFKRFYDIEGNLDTAPGRQIPQAFTKDRTLAMAVNGPRTSEFESAYESGFKNWDLVALPSFADKPGISNQSDMHYYAIPSTGKHQDAAFQVLTAFLSNDGQLELAKSGKLPVVRDKAIEGEYMKNNKAFQGKNIAAFFKNEGAASPTPNKFDDIAFGALNDAFKKVAAGTVDVNTALRSAEEEANKQIAAKQ